MAPARARAALTPRRSWQGATINFYVQTYFLYRLSAISKRHWIMYPVALVVLFGWISCIVAVRCCRLCCARRV